VNDEHGQVLDYEKLVSSGPITFSTDREVPGNIGVTTVFVGADGVYGRYIGLKSYLELAKGKNLLLAYTEPSGWYVGSPAGSFTVNVTHPGTTLKNYFISDASGNADGARLPQGYQTSFLGEVYESPTRYLIFAEDQMSNLRYKIIDKPEKGAQYDFTLEELNEFDQTVEFNFPSTTNYSFAVWSDEPGQDSRFKLAGSQVLGGYTDGTEYTHITGGYLNNFENPTTFLQLEYGTYRNEYNAVGLIPDGKIEWPSADDFNFVSKSINDFEVNASGAFAYRLSHWNWYAETTGINWDVYSPNKGQVIPKIPSEILTGIVNIEQGEFTYAGSKLYTTSSRSYEEFVQQLLEDKTKAPYSEVSITFEY
jgi:hypothetical protein